MDNILINWKKLTQADFLRKMFGPKYFPRPLSRTW